MAYRDPRGGTQPRIWLKNQRPSYPIGAKGYEGSGGNHSYSFENDGMNYVVYMSIIGNTEDDAFIVVAETRTYDSKPAQIIYPFVWQCNSILPWLFETSIYCYFHRQLISKTNSNFI